MRARTLAYVLLALAPAWTLALLGVFGRNFVTSSHVEEYGDDTNRRILAYQRLVQLDQEYSSQLRHGDTDAAILLAQTWISNSRAGTLKDIPPASASDDGLYGVRAEIEEARRNCIHGLMRSANIALDSGNRELSFLLLVDALEISDVSKYSSPHVVATSNQLQNSVANRLEFMLPGLTAAECQRLSRVLDESAPDSNRLANLKSRTKSLAMIMNPEVLKLAGGGNRAQKILASLPNDTSYQVLGDHVNSAIALDTLGLIQESEALWGERVTFMSSKLTWHPSRVAIRYPAR